MLKNSKGKTNMNALITVLGVNLAFSMLLFLNMYKENFYLTVEFQPFMFVAIMAIGLTVGLVYLVGRSEHSRHR